MEKVSFEEILLLEFANTWPAGDEDYYLWLGNVAPGQSSRTQGRGENNEAEKSLTAL